MVYEHNLTLKDQLFSSLLASRAGGTVA
ncbi:hypothetical protein ACNKHM_22360 [Shigella sonnei]